MVSIREVPFEIVKAWAAPAAHDHVAIVPTRNTRWFAGYADGSLVAVMAIMRTGTAARLKAIWVRPEWRHQGIGDDLVTRGIAEAKTSGAAIIEAIAYNPGYYERLGFARYGKTYRNGATKVRKRLR